MDKDDTSYSQRYSKRCEVILTYTLTQYILIHLDDISFYKSMVLRSFQKIKKWLKLQWCSNCKFLHYSNNKV